jgi:DNA-directed RNA polymerase
MGDNENSGAWLAIHGANCYGIDKVSFEERTAWVETFTASILESAFDPFGTEFWRLADKPWPFLAFCMEWAAYLIAGDDHVTHLPVALDGSNSGLQHLSAMLKDSGGARLTCVAPGEQPEDVYQMVADAVEKELAMRQIANNGGDEWAAIWSGKVTRKVVKQPTMTYTYSATVSGMRDQIMSALRELDAKAQESGQRRYLSFTEQFQTNSDAAKYLADVVRKAIASQMKKAAEAMEFLQKAARVYSQTGLPLRWTTPAGMPVVQYYPMAQGVRKDIFINGQRHRLSLMKDDPSRVNKKKASSGVSPNFVHCMDSTHLLWTVLYCNDVHQLTDFAMIHDSFGTHATSCDALASATREMFINLYSVDRLSEFRDMLADSLSLIDPELIGELPDVPSFGTFDIESVRESDYFFA